MQRESGRQAASGVIPMDRGSEGIGNEGGFPGADPLFSRSERREGARAGVLDRPVAWADSVFAWFWNNPFAFFLLVAAAVVSAIWGYVSFYGPQYPRVPGHLWLFVPDSPFALTLWIVAAFAVRAGWDRRPGVGGTMVGFLAAWAAAINVKVGLWTPFILTFYSEVFFAGTPGQDTFQWLLLLAHLGMVPFGFLLLRKMRALPAVGYVGVLALLFLWDFVDYFLVALALPGSGIRVYPLGIPPDGRLVVTTAVTLGLSLVSALVVWVGVRLRGPPSGR